MAPHLPVCQARWNLLSQCPGSAIHLATIQSASNITVLSYSSITNWVHDGPWIAHLVHTYLYQAVIPHILQKCTQLLMSSYLWHFQQILWRLQSHENQSVIQRLSSAVKRTASCFCMHFVTLIGDLQHTPSTVSCFVDSPLTLTHKLHPFIMGITTPCLSFLSFLKS